MPIKCETCGLEIRLVSIKCNFGNCLLKHFYRILGQQNHKNFLAFSRVVVSGLPFCPYIAFLSAWTRLWQTKIVSGSHWNILKLKQRRKRNQINLFALQFMISDYIVHYFFFHKTLMSSFVHVRAPYKIWISNRRGKIIKKHINLKTTSNLNTLLYTQLLYPWTFSVFYLHCRPVGRQLKCMSLGS